MKLLLREICKSLLAPSNVTVIASMHKTALRSQPEINLQQKKKGKAAERKPETRGMSLA